MDDALLAAVGVHKRYGAVHALRGIDFAIRPGELVGLVGDNGAGKSTFVKTLSGAIVPTEGELRWDGTPVTLHSPAVASELGIETVYQDLGLCENLTVTENIYLGRELTRGRGPWRRLDRRRMAAGVAEVLATLAVNVPHPDAKVSQLSGGQRQAVALSRCRLWRRRLVLLDEPTAALGVQESERVVQVIRDLRATGVAIVLISHDIPMVLSLADRVVVLRKGATVADRPAAGLTEHEVVTLITGASEARSTNV
jgi:ABC-type sugar transport system ATPase subunit